MSAADDFTNDARKIAAGQMTRPILVVAGFLVILGLTYCKGKADAHTDAKLIAARDTVQITEKARAVAAETVTVRLRAQGKVDTLVKVASDTTVIIHRDTVRVPPQIVERIVTDDRTIQSLRTLIVADSGDIRALHRLIDLPKSVRHWGIGGTFGYACGPKGCGPGIALGLTWRF